MINRLTSHLEGAAARGATTASRPVIIGAGTPSPEKTGSYGNAMTRIIPASDSTGDSSPLLNNRAGAAPHESAAHGEPENTVDRVSAHATQDLQFTSPARASRGTLSSLGHGTQGNPAAAEDVTAHELSQVAKSPAGGDLEGVPPAGLISPEAMEREGIILAVQAIIKKKGISPNAACREVGVARATHDRWLAKYKAHGIEALQDNYANCGRKPLATLDDVELQESRRLYTQTGSATLALHLLANSAQCRQEVADVILKRRRSKHTLTPTLRQQVAVPDAVLEWHKSPTRVKREMSITTRTKTYLDRAGQERPILPGDLCERDDMSNNFIFWIDWPFGGDPCSDKYGVRIARGQNLMHIDVGSLRFLSFLMLVRLRDSYRADDIWQWVGQTYRDIGIPAIGERWERGIWQANQLRGIPLDKGHTSQDVRLGGIAALGREIIVSQSPTTKIIENRFRYFQRVCSTIPGQIGAKRGEMERVNKLWTQCREGRRDPRDYFLSYEQICDQLTAKVQYVNSEFVEGTIYRGIPNDLWLREGGAQRMTRLTAEQSYLFSRDRHLVTVSKGRALVRKIAPDGARLGWYFYHPELWRHDGQRVAVYMDDQAPASGAMLVFAEGKRANEVIGEAELESGCPQFALGVDFEGGPAAQAALDGLSRQKDFTNAVRAEYRALDIRQTLARGSSASDGRGRRTVVEQTSAPAVAPRTTKPKAAEPEIDPDDIAALEAEAVRRGEFIDY